jgi:two-component sensor histidine kinase
MSVVIAGSGNRPFGVFGVHARTLQKFDQSDVDFLVSLANIVANSARQHAAMERHTLLVREMAHRAGNMLQIVSTIARQTFGPDRDVNDAKRSFVDRLASLARANYLIAEGGWTSTSFQSLLEETLLPFRERLVLSGRDILLAPDLSFDLGLVLHELATNSAKYGTLHADKGQIHISWTLTRYAEADARFLLVWDDPVVPQTAPCPVAGGFGSKLMEALIAQKWGGSVEVDMNGGYRCSIKIPRVA